MRSIRSACVPSFSWKTIPSASSLARRWSSGFAALSLVSGRSLRSVSQKWRASDRRARTTRALPAAIAAPPSRAIRFETRMKRLASWPSGPLQHEAFLVGADGGAHDLGRNVEIVLLEFAHQHDRPFDEAGDLLEQALVLDERQPLGEGEGLGVLEDDRLAPVGVEHDFGLLQRLDVVVEAPDRDRLRRHEAVAPGDVAGCDAVDGEGHDLGRVVRRGEGAEDSAQRAHPAQARRSGPRPRPSASTSARGRRARSAGTISATASLVERPGFSIAAT